MACNRAEPGTARTQQLPVEPLARIAATLVNGASGDLRPNAPALPAYVDRHGRNTDVNIEFATRREVTGDWIVPADGSRSFQLQFAIGRLAAPRRRSCGTTRT